jgi:hypothetical protein
VCGVCACGQAAGVTTSGGSLPPRELSPAEVDALMASILASIENTSGGTAPRR